MNVSMEVIVSKVNVVVDQAIEVHNVKKRYVSITVHIEEYVGIIVVSVIQVMMV